MGFSRRGTAEIGGLRSTPFESHTPGSAPLLPRVVDTYELRSPFRGVVEIEPPSRASAGQGEDLLSSMPRCARHHRVRRRGDRLATVYDHRRPGHPASLPHVHLLPTPPSYRSESWYRGKNSAERPPSSCSAPAGTSPWCTAGRRSAPHKTGCARHPATGSGKVLTAHFTRSGGNHPSAVTGGEEGRRNSAAACSCCGLQAGRHLMPRRLEMHNDRSRGSRSGHIRAHVPNLS